MMEVGLSFSGASIDLVPRLFSDSERDHGHYSNPRIDGLLNNVASTSDPAVRDGDVGTMQRVLFDEVPWMGTTRFAYGRAAMSNVGGLNLWGDNMPMVEDLFVRGSK